MRTSLLAIVLLLAGCPSPGLHVGLTTVSSQQGYTHNTTQKCVRAADAVRLADQALVVILSELEAAGYVKDYFEAAKVARDKLVVCLIHKPEPCSAFGSTLGPFGPTLPGQKRPLAARKRGCATAWDAWASMEWPPVCRPEWPDEPHCVSKEKVSTKGWKAILFHEIFNMAIRRWADYKQPEGNYYAHPIYKVKELARARLGKLLED